MFVIFTVFCPYPGKLIKGRILLIREIGKFEYLPHIKQVRHNEQIQYDCNAVSITNVQWSKKETFRPQNRSRICAK